MVITSSAEAIPAEFGEPVLDVEIHYTLADFLHQYRTTMIGEKYRWEVAIFTLVGLCFLYGGIIGAFSHNVMQSIACLAVAFVMGRAVARPWYAPRQWQKQSQSFRLQIFKTAIRTVHPNSETRYDWAFFTYGWEDDKMLFCGSNAGFACMLPKRIFADNSTQLNMVRDLLSERIENWSDLSSHSLH